MSVKFARFILSVALIAAISCDRRPPSTASASECHPTISRMSPPTEAVEFFANGSSTPDAARQELGTANWFGNEAMWVVLPPNGEIVGRLDDKIAPYRMKRGMVQYEARQVDGSGIVARTPIGPGYGDIGFAAGGPAFPTTGCWQVTYTLDGGDALTFVLRVR